ncbi:hypothetical protein K1719_027872 [Acacia pycnantha]|nr:hypothetical protein K1719_027872 [Acacia pycnantha]
MIKKGWGLDQNMEVQAMPEKNAFLFRFEKQADLNKVLKGCPWSIQGALLNIQHWDDYMNENAHQYYGASYPWLLGPRPNREPVWVSVRYEHVQNYCYYYGKLGMRKKIANLYMTVWKMEQSIADVGMGWERAMSRR